jgi:hypothetical protein
MAKPFLLILCFIVCNLGLAQNRQAQIWKYGENFGNTLDFGFNPIKRTKSTTGFNLAVASICDSNGFHQFSGARALLNRMDSMMPNGLLHPKFGYSYFGCNLIIPFQEIRIYFIIF